MTTRRSLRARVPTAVVLTAAALWTGAVNAWQTDDMLEAATIPYVVPSPDGELVAYVVRRADLESEPSRWGSELFVAAADGSSGRRFTTEDGSIVQPRWSADGEWLAYLRRTSAELADLVVIPTHGGAPRTLTNGTRSVTAFQWSPTGRRLALLGPEPESPARRETPDRVVVGSEFLNHHLWLLDVAPDGTAASTSRLTEGDFHVGSPLLDGAFDWSPDGTEIAFTRTRSARPDDWSSADIAIVEVATRDVRAFQQSNAAEYAPHYAPDGGRIAFNITVFPPSWIRQSRVGLARTDGNALRLLAATPDEQPRIVGWVTDRTLLVEEAHRTTTALWTLPADGGEPRRFDAGDAVLGAVTLNEPGVRLAFTSMNATMPQEAAVTGLRRFRPDVVSAANARTPALPAARTRPVTWHSADGTEVEGLLTLPPGFGNGNPAPPLVLLLHGGPAGVFGDNYLGYHRDTLPLASMAARGWATLRVNPRGSSGYGHAFRAAIRGDWGGADYQDAMAGIDHLVAEGLADPERLAVAGWSYGGYLSAWITTRSHRFNAAVAGAPVTDLAHLSATTDIHGFVPGYLEGEFWEQRSLYAERSPFLHADAITTPLLVLHGQADRRVPVSQGLALHQAMRRRGVATRMVIYPRAAHAIDEPRQILDAARETLAWLDRHL